MVALLHDLPGELAAAHRTFLAPGGTGKAAVEPQRMTLGDVRGAAVRLYPAAPHLVVAEGIESALRHPSAKASDTLEPGARSQLVGVFLPARM